MATDRQIPANRRNGANGGVKTPQGKAVSRVNAGKHGTFASALTPEDAEELHGISDQLAAAIKSVGPVAEVLGTPHAARRMVDLKQRTQCAGNACLAIS